MQLLLKKMTICKNEPYYMKWIQYSTGISLTNTSTGWRNECIVFRSNFESGLFEVQVLEILILIILHTVPLILPNIFHKSHSTL